MALKIEAMKRLSTPVTAARAEDVMAMDFLTTLGFKGLKPKTNTEDKVRYTFTSWNEKKVRQVCGAPKEAKGDSIRYPYGTQGVIAIFEDEKIVVLRNSKKLQDDAEE